MSVATSEENYKLSKSLYQEISDDFYAIENENSGDDTFLIDQTLEKIKKLNRYINRINIDELEDIYDTGVIEILENNVDTFREASYYIERALMSMKLFDKIHPVLKQYLAKVDWNIIGNDINEAVLKLGRFLTHEDNYNDYRNIINNIVKGSMSKRVFSNLFNTISARIAKPKPKETGPKQRNPLPPKMWDDKDREEWEKMIAKRKEEASKIKDEKFKTINFEGFIPLSLYKKIN